MSRIADGTALIAGAALGALAAEPVRRMGGRRGVIGAGVGLVTAAVIYPAARREHTPSAALLIEAGVVLATTGLAVLAAGGSPLNGRRLLALGWASHAIFDVGQGPSADSRLPSWYPPVCAGYDVAFAARLVL